MFLVDPDVTIKWVVRLEPHQRASKLLGPDGQNELDIFRYWLPGRHEKHVNSLEFRSKGMWQDVAGKSFHIIEENRDVSLLQLPIIATWSLLYIDLELVIQPQAW